MDIYLLRVLIPRTITDRRLFTKFIAPIICVKITKVMKDKKLFTKYSVKELLKELFKVKITFLQDHEPIISEVSKKQTKILKAFGMKI